MGFQLMRKLKIGYAPLSLSLKSPGDRRRIVHWANKRGHEIILDLSKKLDVIVASENTDFNDKSLMQKNIPLVFDLIDAYQVPNNYLEDFIRGSSKRLIGQLSGRINRFSNHVNNFCKISNAVICSSIEQKRLIEEHNPNVHVILDFHSEIPFMKFTDRNPMISGKKSVLWEGQSATIRAVKQIRDVLYDISSTRSMEYNFVTDENYFKWLNRFNSQNTLDTLLKDLNDLHSPINVLPWSIRNLEYVARKSSASLIPIDLKIPMQTYKPENRLLIMWRLGLPCLVSPTESYARVAKNSGADVVCYSTKEWVEKLDLLLTNTKYSKEQVNLGQDYLTENHSESIILKKWDMVFDSV
jgi:hypothetical protein